MKTPTQRIAGLAGLVLLLGALVATPVTSSARAALERNAPDLGACEKLAVPEGNVVDFHAYANGVQIYRWDGGAWVLLGPDAVLTADADGNGQIGTHYAGPTWESNSGSKVVGRALERCDAPVADAIPWLKLEAVHTQGPGIFARTTFIQRVNTSGGKAPAYAGAPDEVVRIPYTAEYVFYRAHH
jgi:hypothetical protein